MDPKWIEAGGRRKEKKAYEDLPLIWSRLKDDECPRCQDDIIIEERIIRCVERDECGFIITRAKYEGILADLGGGDIEMEDVFDESDFHGEQ